MTMLQSAKNQLKPISAQQAKELIKTLDPEQYKSIIIDENQKVKRSDHYISRMKYYYAERKIFVIKFPLFENDRKDFSNFEGGASKFDGNWKVEYNAHIDRFKSATGATHQEVSPDKIKGDPFSYPFELFNDEIADQQPNYFLPDYTFKEICPTCHGEKYISCSNPKCKGRHEWNCQNCAGTGSIPCGSCNRQGSNKCSSCGGKGSTTKTIHREGKPIQSTEECSTCHSSGKITCSTCNGKGENNCPECNGMGKIICDVCYSDQERYGKIDCPECSTAGMIARFVYVETTIHEKDSIKVLKKGDKIEIDSKLVLSKYDKDADKLICYNNINGKTEREIDEISQTIIPEFEKEMECSKSKFPLLLQERLNYQVVPCIEVAFTHMLTKENHTLIIYDIWGNPEILYPTDPEKLSMSAGSIARSVGSVFSSLFKTKAHKKKEDTKIEIKLMIYLAKADGKIAEQEKKFIHAQIDGFLDLTNSEKKYFFNLINEKQLPDLTKEDLNFSDSSKGMDVVNKLKELAKSDNDFDQAERELIEKIESLLK
jgi:uncharacterized tellurite resistance protein B-like protein